MTQTTYANTATEPLNLDMAAMMKAMAMIERQPDTVKKMTLTTSNWTKLFKEAEPHLIKDVSCIIDKFAGIPIILNNYLPQDCALLEYASGKKVLMNLVTGNCVTIPAPQLEYFHVEA